MILLFLLIPILGIAVLVNFGVVESALALFITITGEILNFILKPVNAVISESIPNLSNAIAAINAWLDYAATYLNWIADASLIPQEAISLIIAYMIFAFGIGFFTWGFKLAFKWYGVIFR